MYNSKSFRLIAVTALVVLSLFISLLPARGMESYEDRGPRLTATLTATLTSTAPAATERPHKPRTRPDWHSEPTEEPYPNPYP